MRNKNSTRIIHALILMLEEGFKKEFLLVFLNALKDQIILEVELRNY